MKRCYQHACGRTWGASGQYSAGALAGQQHDVLLDLPQSLAQILTGYCSCSSPSSCSSYSFRHLRLLFVIVVLFHLDLIYHQKYYHQTRETHPRSHPGDAVKEKSCALPADRRRRRRLHPRARHDTHLRERAHLLARRRGECTRPPLRPAALLPRRRHRAALRDRPAAGSALRRGLRRSALRGDRGAR